MLNIAICDDDALHGRHTAAQISALDGFAAAKLSLFTSADNLIYAITEDNYAVDIAVLDIQMESMDGIELAKRINELAPECQVIFLSGHIEYASKVYDAEHVFFVLKSQSETYLKGALEKAVHRREGALPRGARGFRHTHEMHRVGIYDATSPRNFRRVCGPVEPRSQGACGRTPGRMARTAS